METTECMFNSEELFRRIEGIEHFAFFRNLGLSYGSINGLVFQQVERDQKEKIQPQKIREGLAIRVAESGRIVETGVPSFVPLVTDNFTVISFVFRIRPVNMAVSGIT